MTIFTDQAAIVAELRTDRLFQVGQSYFPDWTPSDDYIYGKVLSAEKDAERQLRVFFEPVEVVTEGTTQAEKDQLDTDGKRWIEEPAYDYHPDFFKGEKWGYLPTRHRPIISVASFKFVYPSPENPIFAVPDEWIRIDKKYGHIRLVPTGVPFYAPLNAYIMSAVGGGRTIPHTIQIRYVAGLKDALNQHPDLVDLIKKMAILRIVEDLFLPQSGTISADGLSQSLSIDTDKYQVGIEQRIKTLRDEIHGIRVAFL